MTVVDVDTRYNMEYRWTEGRLQRMEVITVGYIGYKRKEMTMAEGDGSGVH